VDTAYFGVRLSFTEFSDFVFMQHGPNIDCSSYSDMPVVKWKNAGCSEAGLQLMTDCAKKVEDKILKHQEEQRLLKGESGTYAPNDPAGYPFHVPTALNDELHPSCIAVAVSHNSGM
jgi:hypothetical protein